ncbi:hypothetical protein B9G69_001725 [Bdellovibrio sp. SKB1291214]|uniref:alkyl sulfatase C-terminal domain-containing protein n=1 Tax=Bdellovibrio sp. SKB1291214 TaxID=1732569 RepID=UPI0020CB7113|nr:alkyl sulfatase C-terminal domain-containing protein [Bdellovibrio sp. SKB1291214]UYL10781.1 hypothetical protein B9G69_001725 [Bdellovibrio sp. SKB1291214]
MGFQSESGPWRDVYLSGAAELRGQTKKSGVPLVDPVTLPLALLIEYTGLRLDPAKANGITKRIGLNTTDTKEKYTLVLNNSVLSLQKPTQGEKLDATYSLKSREIGEILGTGKNAGSFKGLGEIAGMLDHFDPAFSLVTPVEETKDRDDRMASAED